MNTFINADIQVSNVESRMASTGNMKYILTDHNKKKYYFYEQAKGTVSDVYSAFKAMGVKIGSTVHISFTEEAKTFTDKNGKEVQYTDRFIGSMREAGGNPQIQKPASKTEYVSEKDDSFWDKKAYKQCLWNYWLEIKKGQEFTDDDANIVWNVFRNIEKDAEKRFSPVAKAALQVNSEFFEVPAPTDPFENIPF